MELSLAQQLEGIIEKLVTKGGGQELDKPLIKKLKSLCKKCENTLKHCFHLIMAQFEKQHSEVRYATFLIVKELFVRSHLFRQLLLEDFNEFMDLTMGTDFDYPLPPPKHVAEKLKTESLQTVKEWHDKYSIAYPKLALAVHFLSTVKHIKFDRPTPQQSVERQMQEQRAEHKQIMDGIRLDKVKKSVEKSSWEIKRCTNEMKNCLLLLVPDFKDDDENISVKAGDASHKNANNMRNLGLPESGYSVEIDLSSISKVEVKTTQDNAAVLDTMKDHVKAANRIHLPRLRSWLTVATKCGASGKLVKDLIDQKAEMQRVLVKYKELNLKGSESIKIDSDESDCDDFVEVPDIPVPSTSSKVVKKRPPKLKKIQNPKSKKAVSDTNVWKPLRNDKSADDPTSYQYALSVQAEKRKMEVNDVKPEVKPKKLLVKQFAPTKQKKSLYGEAPVVPFGKDLYAWDQEKEEELRQSIEMGSAKAFDIGHRFYGGSSASERDGGGVSDAALTALTTRTIEFAGDFKPVTRICGVPLPSGKLCPRQDRFKCPFHGKIIDRDMLGHPKYPDQSQNPSSSHSLTSSSWQESQERDFLKDIEISSGGKVKLTPTKKGKRSRKVENGLTDLQKLNDTSRSRLQKKILNPGSLKRVAGKLDTLDKRRNDDKFGNNFSYALN